MSELRAGVPAVVLAVAAVSVFSGLNSLQVAMNYARQFPDVYGVARAEDRFAGLTQQAPKAAAELGYITDLDRSGTAYEAALMAARYALAPRRLTPVVAGAGAHPEWAAGNFSRPQDFAAAGGALGYGVSADLGNGVVLFRRRAQ
jgi:hypothetical protein